MYPSARTTLATLVEPQDRRRLDAAGHGRFSAQHVTSLRQVVRVVRERAVDAVLVSPSCMDADQLRVVGQLVRRFPGVPTVAVVSRYDLESSERLLELGACGVRHALDLSRRDGWQRLRALLTHPTAPVAGAILARLMPALGEPTPGVRVFFQVLARVAPRTPSARSLARRLNVPCSTLVSRFLRTGLPSPKRYLGTMRLVHAANLFESGALSVTDVAHRLEFSSPQSLGRHLRNVMGVTATEFRRRYRFRAMLQEFIARLIVPFRSLFLTFHPLGDGVGDLGQEW